MKHEDWIAYQHQAKREQIEKFGSLPQTQTQAIADLRAELDGLAGRIKAELLSELRTEVERLIAMEVTYASRPQ